MSSSARKKMARRSSSMASLARFITWNGSWTMATCLSFGSLSTAFLNASCMSIAKSRSRFFCLPFKVLSQSLRVSLGASVADPDRLAGLQVAD
jgi:hypothetical protein